MNHLGDWTAYYARRTPDAEAIFDPRAGRRLTWRALDRAANRLANTLAGARGVGRGDRVAVLAHNRSEHFELLFACAKLGALFVPLNWRLAPSELDGILADAEPRVLLFDPACAPLVAGLALPRAQRLALDGPAAEGEDLARLLALASDGAPPRIDLAIEEPWIICYTSGTTGRPKGALLSHRQLLFNSLSTQLAIGLAPSDSTLVFMPLFHTGGLNCLATPLLHHGGRVVLMPGFEPDEALALSERERITLQMGVPTIFQLLRDAPAFASRDLAATRMVLCGGAPCPLALIDDYRQRGIQFRQGYGLTEVGPNCFSLVAGDAFRKAGSVGWPNFYLRAEIVDDAGHEVQDGATGELRLGGPMTTLGYFRNPAATADAFRGGAWFHTGDLVRRDDEGYHYIVDRKKDMFISGGENVYPAEVEQALAGLGEVAEVCVIPIPDPRWGEVGRAVIVPRPGAIANAPALLGALTGRLARYKIPKSVVFASALPRNAAGKILRQAVRDQHGQAGS